VKIVGARFADEIYDRTRVSAIFGKKLVRNDADLTYRVRIIQRDLAARNARIVDVLAVKHEVVRAKPATV
jgi:hypothetical protein